MREQNEQAYWTHEVAERLEIGESTLRKWCLALEEQGMTFVKGEQESRAFLENDIAVLERMKEEIRLKKKSMKNAAKIILDERRTPVVQEEQVEDRTPVVQEEQKFSLEDVKLIIQQEVEKQVEERVKQEVEKQLGERDKLLVQSLRESQEFRRMLVVQQEQAAAAKEEEEEEKKKGWWEFWKKK